MTGRAIDSNAAIGGHQSARMVSDVWLTPPEIIARLGPFDLDPCAAPRPRPWNTAQTHIQPPSDGLAVEWWGRVWLNPPYSREAVKWVERLADHGSGTALTFARTETSWFVRQIWNRATAVLFLDGRLYFHRRDGSRAAANAGAPSVLVAYSDYDAQRLRDSGIAGSYCEGWRLTDRGGAGITEGGGVPLEGYPPPEPRCNGLDTGCTGDPSCPVHMVSA